MKNTIVLIAVNHPYYGLLAANLAMSIKASNPVNEVVVFYDEGSQPSVTHPLHGRYFDKKVLIDRAMYVDGKKKHYGLLKLKLNELCAQAGITRALYIDVDSFVVPGKNLDRFFQFIDAHGFGMEFRGLLNLHTSNEKEKIGGWASVGSARGKLVFANPEIPSFTQSSWVGFDLSNPEVTKVFLAAQEVFDYYLNAQMQFSWYNTVPDELCFTLACAITGYPAHRDLNYCYFDTGPHTPDRKNILENFDLYTLPSAGGYRAMYAEFYNQMIGVIAAKSRLTTHTTFKDKRNLFTPVSLRNNRK